MPRDLDTQTLDAAAVRRDRLRNALLWGPEAPSRQVGELLRALIGSVIIAAVLCAGCVGWSYMRHALAKQQRSQGVVSK